MASYYKCKVPMPGTVRDPSPRVSATGCEDGRRLSVGSGGRGHAPTQILSDDDPSPRVSATGCEDSRRLSVGSGGRGHAPTQILISEDDARAGERGHAPYPNADNKVHSIVGSLKQLCPRPREQVYGDSAPVPPDWLHVKKRSREVELDGGSKVDLHKFVAEINKFAWQKKGGIKASPKVPDSSHCLLCSDGSAVCLGPSCKGKKMEQQVSAPDTFHLLPQTPPTMPGLTFVENSSSKPSKRYVLNNILYQYSLNELNTLF